MIWIAFFTGLFIGTFLSIFVIGFCRIAADADREMESIFDNASLVKGKYENKKG